MDPETEIPDGSGLHYGKDDMDRLYARVWGDSIHFGVYESATTDLEAAVFECKRRMAMLAGLGADQHVLEVASGWGATARYLARVFGVSVTATNIEAQHQAVARALSEGFGLSRLIHHETVDFHALPFADHTFDVWWCQEATVHASDKPRVAREAFRVLKPGGRIVFSDQTTVQSLLSADEARRLSARHGSGDLFAADDFCALLRQAGFTGIAVFDWRDHMARHFANLVRRIERTHAALALDIPKPTLDFNLSLWRLGYDLAGRGAIGWHCFRAEKP
jgi:ubiquinone/menaquinone biosynthesis C-methylase UbiE